MANTNQDLFRQLASIAFSPVSNVRKPSDYDVALEILRGSQGKLNSSRVWSPALSGNVAPQPQKGGGGGSVFGHIVDWLSRPLYASASAYKASGGVSSGFGMLKHLATGDMPENPLDALASGAVAGWKGLKGEDKTTYSDVIRESDSMPEWSKKGVPGFITGLGANILGDPLTYVPIAGPAKAGIRAGYKIAGKEIPYIALPKATKQAMKAAKVGSPRLTEPSTIVPSNMVPEAFRAQMGEATAKPLKRTLEEGLAPNRFSIQLPTSGSKLPLEGAALTSPKFKLPAPAIKEASADLARIMSEKATPAKARSIPQAVFKPAEESVREAVGKSPEELEAMARKALKEAQKSTKFKIDEDAFIEQYVKHQKGLSLGNAARNPNSAIKLGETVAKAMEDAPVVNTALEQGAKDAAIAEHTLSAQQAALHSKEFNKEAEAILEASGASSSAKKTYKELMSAITYKSRGPVQNAIDRNATKLTIPMNPMLRKSIRGSKGRFLSNSAALPTVAKLGGTRPFVRGEGIIPREAVEMSAQAASAKLGVPVELKYLRLPKGPKPKPVKSVKDIFGPVNTAVSNALRESAGIPITKLKPGQTISERDAVHGIVARFATWAGQKDLRPMVLDHMSSAVARASARARAMENAFKGFKDDEILEAWEVARNAKPRGIASSDTVTKLADTLTGQMEQYFRSRAVPEALAKGNSMAMRSGMMMKDLNQALKRYNVPFEFTAGEAINPITQKAISYSDKSNWLISWETHTPKTVRELKQFMFGLHSAAEQVASKYAFLDDVAYRMGSRGKTATKNVKIDNPRLVDYYFDKEIADQLSTALKTMDQFYSPKSPVTRFMRQALSTWKTGVTIYNPRHHIANVIGDTMLMWMAGINDPRVFAKSAKVMFANKGLYKDLASVDELIGRNAVKNSLAKPGSVVARNKNGHGFTAQQVYTAAFNFGLLQKAGVVEDIAKEGLPLGRLGRPFNGAVHNKVAGFSENREHYVKLAHFIGAIEKSHGKNSAQIFENAAHEVRKWHPDGLDLTKEEQAIRAIGVPFYSWLRKSTPLIIEGALMNPQKAFTAYAKVGYSAQQSVGIQGTTLSDPYPDDQLFPSWLRDDNVPVLGKTGLPGIAGALGGLGRQGNDDKGNPLDAYTMLGPTNPVQDFFTQFGGFRSAGGTGNAALSQINPMLRIPLEMQAGKEMYTGIPLEGRKADYLTNQIPMVNQVARMTNVGPFGKTKRAEDYGIGNREAFLNWTTGMNLTGTGPYIKTAEFEELPKKREENKAIRKFSAQIGYPLNEKGKIPDWIRELYVQRNGG